MRILFLNQTHTVLPDGLRALGHEIIENITDDYHSVKSQISDYQGIVFRSRIDVDREFLDAARHLKFIARAGAGLEHIDTNYAAQIGVPILSSPEGSSDAVGEHALGMLLGLVHNLTRADRQVRAGEWIREGNRGIELGGKTVGIIGYGNMGKSFARKISGLGVKTIAYDKFKINYGDDFAQAVDLPTIFEEADIVSLHIPYLPENHHFVNAAFLAAFKKPIFIVNTARGIVLNTADLVQHLQAGTVRGAALDVLEYEESSFQKMSLDNMPAPFQYLKKADNVVLAPHIAGWSVESRKGHAEVLLRKIKEII
ncbi:MAG: NAD(P)-dependent oxidoreductase [Saprospiraceae bacterium]